ncbi:MAG: hypothetical protein GY811_26585 [Myxococcales bacterium]|nr:hypothetical protein [Myxococcales bacterium]
MVSNIVVLPGAIAAGLAPVLTLAIEAMITPLTMGVIVLRERHLRREASEEIGARKTARAVLREYSDFAKAHRKASSAKAKAFAAVTH